MLLAETQIPNAELISNKHQTLWMYQSQGGGGNEEELKYPLQRQPRVVSSPLPVRLLLFQREQPFIQPALEFALPSAAKTQLHFSPQLSFQSFFGGCRKNTAVTFIKSD